MREVSLPTTVIAGDIQEGECFRKRTGKYLYMRISESAVRFYIEPYIQPIDPKEGPEPPLDCIYGVCLLNGNMIKLAKEILVIREQVGFTRHIQGFETDDGE